MPLISFFDKGGKKRRGQFRYDRRLCKNEEAKKVITEAWLGDHNSSVMEKLANARSAISAWNRKQQRNSKMLIEKKKRELNVALSSRANDIALIQDISKQLDAAYSEEEEFWKQCNRLLWLKLGDRNTGYFHAITKVRKRINAFSVLENEEGGLVYKEEEIVNVIGGYFNNLFTSTPGEREEIVNQALSPIISDEDNALLNAIPTALEIKEAAFSINAEKAPGPDGFSAGFFHTHWERIGSDIVKEVQGFFCGMPLPEDVNDTNIRLIPKIKNPQKVSDYRPIALCNVYYKIYSKILTRRLQPHMDRLISENQSAFVPGRAIGDNILITHEVLHFLKTSKAEQICAMAVKTDMSKAYDRLEWDFVALVPSRLGFHRDWIRAIMQCISTVTYSFLINGLPRGKVVPSRGIRQGDPLSPYIFIMCSEVLSGLCNKAQEEGDFNGLQVARGCPRIFHLLFADDTMFFLHANKRNCKTLNDILRKYGEASGQSINVDKSSITFSNKAPADLKEMVKNELKIQKDGGMGKYLGLPEQFGRRKRDLYASIIDRIQQKSRGWSTKFLSSAGKLVMLQSVLAPTPSFAMSSFKLPVSLCKRIQSVVTRFWWDDNEEKKKMAWVSWERISKPKASGGLGIRDFQKFNDALLAKIGWRLLENPESLLGKTLFGKYCPENNILEASPPSVMSHGWRSVLVGRDLLLKKIGWAVGDGKSINIWRDPWLSMSTQLRPMGPPNEQHAAMVVADLMLPGGRHWDLQKIRLILPEYEDLILSIKHSTTGAPDKLMWLGTKSGEYATKSGYYAAMEDEDHQDNEFAGPDFNWKKCVWNVDTAPKLKLFAWKILKGALPVGERLVDRHIDIDPKCKRCGCIESITHVLFHCPFARKVWRLAPLVSDVECSGMVDLIASWNSLISLHCLPPTGISSGSLTLWIL